MIAALIHNAHCRRGAAKKPDQFNPLKQKKPVKKPIDQLAADWGARIELNDGGR